DDPGHVRRLEHPESVVRAGDDRGPWRVRVPGGVPEVSVSPGPGRRSQDVNAFSRRFARLVLTAALVVPAAAFSWPGSTAGAQTWALAATATVHPGVQLITNGAQCTA